MRSKQKKIYVRRGFNLNLQGEANRISVNLPKSKTFAIKPPDFFTINPKLLVKEGSLVKIGSPLFFSKINPRISFSSPVSGKVTKINRGYKRKILEIIINADNKESYLEFQTYNHESIEDKEIIELLLKSGSWPFIKQRPYGIIASPEDSPKSIFISTFSTSPLAVDYDFILKNNKNDFQIGIDILNRLTNGSVYLAIDDSFNGFFNDIRNVEKVFVNGPHPAGNTSIHIHNVDPINISEKVWTVNPEDVVNIGIFFKTGKFSPKRTIALAGSSVKKPQYYKTIIGSSISNLLDHSEVNYKNNNRYISGDILSGITVGPDNYMSYYNNSLIIIPEGNKYRFMGWLPFVNNYIPSMYKTSLSWLFMRKKFIVNTNLNGEERAFVVTGEMEKVFPMDIFPMQLIKACLYKDVERMEALGIYEVIPEDFGLIDYGSTSKIEAQKIIREGIELMIKEVG